MFVFQCPMRMVTVVTRVHTVRLSVAARARRFAAVDRNLKTFLTTSPWTLLSCKSRSRSRAIFPQGPLYR